MAFGKTKEDKIKDQQKKDVRAASDKKAADKAKTNAKAKAKADASVPDLVANAPISINSRITALRNAVSVHPSGLGTSQKAVIAEQRSTIKFLLGLQKDG